jgi:hypothetical protein
MNENETKILPELILLAIAAVLVASGAWNVAMLWANQ